MGLVSLMLAEGAGYGFHAVLVGGRGGFEVVVEMAGLDLYGTFRFANFY